MSRSRTYSLDRPNPTSRYMLRRARTWASAVRGSVLVAALTLCGAFALPAHGADLELRLEGDGGPFDAGDTVTVGLWMRDLGATPVAGFQAFLEFDTSALTLLSAAYTPLPFSLPVIMPIAVAGGDVDLAAGIDIINGQMPTSDDARLAVLTFIADQSFCKPPIEFRAHEPPSRLTDDEGGNVLPLDLLVFPPGQCLGDLNNTGFVDFSDLLIVLQSWGSPCPGDLDGDGDTNFTDVLILLSNWGPCP